MVSARASEASAPREPTNTLFARRIGLVPDQARGLAFATTMLVSALQVTAKVGGTALLAITNGKWLVYYFAGDHMLHLLYRIARRDLVVSHVPSFPVVAYPLSTLVLIIYKVMTDFTGCMGTRLPLVQGGSYWLFR